MSTLTSSERDRLPSSEFAIPERRAYPIENREHAINALARVAQNGTPSEKTRVRNAVYRRYPDLKRAHQRLHR